jgi:hypothetical protein
MLNLHNSFNMIKTRAVEVIEMQKKRLRIYKFTYIYKFVSQNTSDSIECLEKICNPLFTRYFFRERELSAIVRAIHARK